MSEVVSHSGTKLTVPVPVTAPPVGGGAKVCGVALASIGAGVEPDGAASTKAEGGNPPMVAASPAFSA